MKRLLVALILLSTNLFAGTRDPSTSDTKYVEYGSKFHYVFKICGVQEDKKMFCGSSVAISPEWILTAAHVVKDAKNCGIHIEDSVILIDEIICHKDYDSTDFGKSDIALCHLAENLDLSFYPELYEQQDEVGKICCMAGYGITGTFITGPILSDGKRRAGSNIIDKVYKDLLICTPSKFGTKGMTTLEYIICSGDSGGGLFINNRLAGINSCVLTEGRIPNSIYGDEAGHTRISIYVPWIKKVISR